MRKPYGFACRFGRVHDKTIFTRPHDESTPDGFFDAGVYRGRDEQGYRLRFTVSVRGTRIADARGERRRGTFRAKVLVTRRGHHVDTCRTGRLRFTARPDQHTESVIERRFAAMLGAAWWA
jgi:hypothetical protein